MHNPQSPPLHKIKNEPNPNPFTKRYHGVTAHPRLGAYRNCYRTPAGHTLWEPKLNNGKAVGHAMSDNLAVKSAIQAGRSAKEIEAIKVGNPSDFLV